MASKREWSPDGANQIESLTISREKSCMLKSHVQASNYVSENYVTQCSHKPEIIQVETRFDERIKASYTAKRT